MFIRKYWIPITVFLVVIVGVGIPYYLQTRPPKPPILIIKPVEPLPKSEVKAPVEETSQGGHRHADGTWHEVPHDPVEQPPPAVPSLSDAELAAIPEDMPEPDIPLPADLSDSEALNRWTEKYIAEWQKYVHALDMPIKRLMAEIDQMTVELPPENAPEFAAAKAKLLAKKQEHHKLGVEKNARVHKWMATTDKLFADNIKGK